MDIQSFATKSIAGYLTLYLGSYRNKLSDYFLDEYFSIRNFQFFLGSYVQTLSTPCLLSAGRNVPYMCMLCAEGYFL